jgi:GDP/UDP-N,N'-diacetylbacillosamine 2-epimerase (hydrolysing)
LRKNESNAKIAEHGLEAHVTDASSNLLASTTKKVCFVTGTRAEFGLMRSVLRAIQETPTLRLQIVVTGMHLDARHGDTIQQIRRENWTIDRIVDWKSDGSPSATANATGLAMASLAAAYRELKTDIVLIVGDRVEAFAAAAAGHISGVAVAHVHGGDRAAGQIDDSLRHAITKLAHIHFPATKASEERILKLGEDSWRVHRCGSPGIDGIVRAAVPRDEVRAIIDAPFALLVLHPVDEPDAEFRRALKVVSAIGRSVVGRAVIVYPNNDPGSSGIIAAWEKVDLSRHLVFHDLPRATFLGLMRDAVALVGNSSSGIIEAASFGTPVVDIGPRQLGREHGENVVHVGYAEVEIHGALTRIWNNGKPKRFPSDNLYGGGRAGQNISRTLAKLKINNKLLRKLSSY